MRNDNSRRRGKRPGAVPLQCNSRRLVTNWTQLWNRTHVEVEGPHGCPLTLHRLGQLSTTRKQSWR